MAKGMGFAVVGLGMGGHHCKAVTAAKGARLVAVCDIDTDRLSTFTNQYGCKGYTKWTELLKDREIDAVCVAVESGKHAEFGIDAARAGKHIIMEKPVDITPERVKKLRDVVKRTRVKCGCIFQSRLDNCNILLKKAIDKGKLGKLIGVHGSLPWWRAQDYYSGPHGKWKGTWRLDGGGSLMNQGIHTVDLLQWLAGPVKSVCGFYGVFGHTIEAEDQTVAILKYESGALGTLFTTTCAQPDRDQRLHIYGTKGSFSKLGSALEFFEAGTDADKRYMMDVFGARKSGERTSSDPMAVSSDGHMLIIEDLIKAVRTGRDPVITIESAGHAVEIANAIFKSAKTGREVKISDVRK
ncbi:MAG: Gfo/Idh/MocA family oxidoreductase [Candidatus Hydrogenedentes bacterium]|nr:Gfo/Idh/MocA family oxidoreductase [Candidatus Hydrogenedentota bacterium]